LQALREIAQENLPDDPVARLSADTGDAPRRPARPGRPSPPPAATAD
jgi:hypothetical protein